MSSTGNDGILGWLYRPLDDTVTKVELGNWEGITPLLGGPDHEVRLFDVVRLRRGEDVYVDDEGLCYEDGNPLGYAILTIDGKEHLLAGNLLFLGSTADGEMVSTKLTEDEVWKMVKWTVPDRIPKPRFTFIPI